MKSIIFVLLVLLIVTATVSAQDTAPSCDLAPVSEALTKVTETITGGDVEASLVALHELQSLIAETEAICSGMSFSSEQNGLSPVLGPLSFPDGTWIATMTVGEGYTSVKFEDLSGDCDRSNTVVLYSQTEPIEKAQKFFTTEGDCAALVGVEASNPWQLHFELVKAK